MTLDQEPLNLAATRSLVMMVIQQMGVARSYFRVSNCFLFDVPGLLYLFDVQDRKVEAWQGRVRMVMAGVVAKGSGKIAFSLVPGGPSPLFIQLSCPVGLHLRPGCMPVTLSVALLLSPGRKRLVWAPCHFHSFH